MPPPMIRIQLGLRSFIVTGGGAPALCGCKRA
jgi:hypothetical protein